MSYALRADRFIPFATKLMTTETGMLAPSDKRGRGTRVLHPRFYTGSRRRRHDTYGVLSWRGKYGRPITAREVIAVETSAPGKAEQASVQPVRRTRGH